jgi:hypothetical protein
MLARIPPTDAAPAMPAAPLALAFCLACLLAESPTGPGVPPPKPDPDLSAIPAQPARDSRPLYIAVVWGLTITPHDPPIFCPTLSSKRVRCRHISLCRRWRMRDLAADWRRWSAGERVLAIVVMGALIGLPVAVWF